MFMFYFGGDLSPNSVGIQPLSAVRLQFSFFFGKARHMLFRVTCLVSCVLFVFSVPGQAQSQQDRPLPNIVLIVSDDAGFSDIGSFGGEIHTPNLDRIAREGVRFARFYTNARCSPTRASLMTGHYAHKVGIGDLARAIRVTDLPGYLGYLNGENNITMPELLRLKGYKTLMSGKWHLGGFYSKNKKVFSASHPTKRGFEKFFGILGGASNYFKPRGLIYGIEKYREELDPEYYVTDLFTDFALKFVAEHERSETADQPFFLYLPYTAPHEPLVAPQVYVDKYMSIFAQEWWLPNWDDLQQWRFKRAVEEGVVSPDWRFRRWYEPTYKAGSKVRPEIVLRMATHAAMMEIMDANIGRLVEELDKSGELDNTIIIYMSDNGASGHHYYLAGTPFIGQKGTLWEGGTRTHMVMWGHDFDHRSGDVIFETVHVMDILPTILELVGMEYPELFNSRKLEPISGQSFLQGLIDDKWQSRGPLFWDLYDYKAVVDGDLKYLKTDDGDEFLFDLKTDAAEIVNLKDKYPAKLEEFKAMHDVWAQENYVLPLSVYRSAQPEFADKSETP